MPWEMSPLFPCTPLPQSSDGLFASMNVIRYVSPLGNRFFAAQEYQKAIGKYVKIIGYAMLPTIHPTASLLNPMAARKTITQEEQNLHQEAEHLLLSAYSNVAQCYLNLKKPEKVREYCQLVLKIDSDHIKSHYRLAKLCADGGDIDGALNHIRVLDRLGKGSDAGVIQIKNQIIHLQKMSEAKENKIHLKLAKMLRQGNTSPLAPGPSSTTDTLLSSSDNHSPLRNDESQGQEELASQTEDRSPNINDHLNTSSVGDIEGRNQDQSQGKTMTEEV